MLARKMNYAFIVCIYKALLLWQLQALTEVRPASLRVHQQSAVF